MDSRRRTSTRPTINLKFFSRFLRNVLLESGVVLFFTRGVSTVIFIEGGYKPAPERKMIKLLTFDIKLVSVIKLLVE